MAAGSPFINNAKIFLYQTGLFQRVESTVLCNCLQGTGTELYGHKAIQFRYPNPFRLEVRRERSGRVGGDVLTNAPFFLGHSAPMNHVTLGRFGPCNAAFSRHRESSCEELGRSTPLSSSSRPNLVLGHALLLLVHCITYIGSEAAAICGSGKESKCQLSPVLAQLRTCATVT